MNFFKLLGLLVFSFAVCSKDKEISHEKDHAEHEHEPIKQCVIPYAIEKAIGRGGTADVYATNDPNLVIKIWRLDKHGKPRFLHLLRNLRVFDHVRSPHVLQATCYQIANGQPALVMQRCEQSLQSLQQRRKLNRKPLVRDELLYMDEITRQIYSGVIALHEYGITHNDIKPENFLMIGDKLHIADFDYAAILGECVAGWTKQTASPEILKEMGQKYDENKITSFLSDWFSVGATLYMLYTGDDSLPKNSHTYIDFNAISDKLKYRGVNFETINEIIGFLQIVPLYRKDNIPLPKPSSSSLLTVYCQKQGVEENDCIRNFFPNTLMLFRHNRELMSGELFEKIYNQVKRAVKDAHRRYQLFRIIRPDTIFLHNDGRTIVIDDRDKNIASAFTQLPKENTLTSFSGPSIKHGSFDVFRANWYSVGMTMLSLWINVDEAFIDVAKTLFVLIRTNVSRLVFTEIARLTEIQKIDEVPILQWPRFDPNRVSNFSINYAKLVKKQKKALITAAKKCDFLKFEEIFHTMADFTWITGLKKESLLKILVKNNCAAILRYMLSRTNRLKDSMEKVNSRIINDMRILLNDSVDANENTLLHMAVDFAGKEVISILIKFGAVTHKVNAMSEDPVYYAMSHDAADDIVNCLLEPNPAENLCNIIEKKSMSMFIKAENHLARFPGRLETALTDSNSPILTCAITNDAENIFRHLIKNQTILSWLPLKNDKESSPFCASLKKFNPVYHQLLLNHHCYVNKFALNLISQKNSTSKLLADLLEKHADVIRKSPSDHPNILQTAIMNGALKCVKVIYAQFKNEKKVWKELSIGANLTTLMIACKYRKIDGILWLLNNDAESCNSINKEASNIQETALGILFNAMGNNIPLPVLESFIKCGAKLPMRTVSPRLREAITDDNIALFMTLLKLLPGENGVTQALINDPEEDDDVLLLIYAARAKKENIILALLDSLDPSERSAYVQEVDEDNNSALHYCIFADLLHCSQKLIEFGADINATTDCDLSPIMLATSPSVILLLIRNGVHLSDLKTDSDNCIFLNYLALHGSIDEWKEVETILGIAQVDKLYCKDMLPVLFSAIDSPKNDIIDYMLSNTERAKIFLQNSKNPQKITALMRAAYHGKYSILTRLLELEDNINEKNIEGNNALFYAAAVGNLECTELLLNHEADCFSQAGKYGLIHGAISGGNIRILELLKNKFKDDLNAWNRLCHAGTTNPLKFGVERGQSETLKWFFHQNKSQYDHIDEIDKDPTIFNILAHKCTENVVETAHFILVDLKWNEERENQDEIKTVLAKILSGPISCNDKKKMDELLVVLDRLLNTNKVCPFRPYGFTWMQGSETIEFKCTLLEFGINSRCPVIVSMLLSLGYEQRFSPLSSDLNIAFNLVSENPSDYNVLEIANTLLPYYSSDQVDPKIFVLLETDLLIFTKLLGKTKFSRTLFNKLHAQFDDNPEILKILKEWKASNAKPSEKIRVEKK